MTDSEALLAAADLIDRSGLARREMWPGWGAGESYPPDGPCCAWGAIAVVLDCHPADPPAYRLLCKLDRFLGESVVGWQDDPDRTDAEVTAYLRHVARVWA